jgi:hypothetical protein
MRERAAQKDRSKRYKSMCVQASQLMCTWQTKFMSKVTRVKPEEKGRCQGLENLMCLKEMGVI